jgi:geranylgeranyl diphosphate synthase type II
MDHAVTGRPWTGPGWQDTGLGDDPRSAASLVGAIDRRLDELVPDGDGDADAPASLRDAMRHVLLAPGKRLRPLLALASTAELGADPAVALDAACALEMIHAASLALDDLPCMDDARLRRGRPTLHVAYGEDVAILASIALLSRAFSVVAGQRTLAPRVRAGLAATLAECVGSEGLAGGQFDDLRGAAQRTGDSAQRCNLRKTGALFAAAIEVGTQIAQAPAARRARLREFALHLGCAFQIRDDVLDATRTSAEVGKDTGRDAGKCTVVALLGVEQAHRELRAHLNAAHRAATGDTRGGPRSSLVEFLRVAFGAELPAALA